MIQFLPPDDEPVQPVQGQMPDSKEEYWVAKALYKLDIPFMYQYELFGGNIPGGIIVDFVVFAPMTIPVEVFGEYWHPGNLSADDQMKLIRERDHFGYEPVILWAEQLVDEETTYEVVKKELML